MSVCSALELDERTKARWIDGIQPNLCAITDEKWKTIAQNKTQCGASKVGM